MRQSVEIVLLDSLQDNHKALSACTVPQVLVLFLCATIFGCFVYELAAVKPVWIDVAKGFIPTPEILTNNSMLYTAIGILGKTAETLAPCNTLTAAWSMCASHSGLFICSGAG